MKNWIFKLRLFIVFALLGACISGLNAQAVQAPQTEAYKVEVAPSVLKTPQKMREETKYFVMSLENIHYSKIQLKDLDIREFIAQYMQNLDFFKMFFLAGDVQFYQDEFSGSMDPLLHEGVLLPANKIYYETFVPRAKERLDWIKKRMEQPFELESELTFNPDRSKESWPQTMEEADQLWDCRLRFDIIGQILGYDHSEKELEKELFEETERKAMREKNADEDDEDDETPKTFEEKLEKAKNEVLKRYDRVISNIVKNDNVEVQELFLNSLSNLFDPHSSFLSEYYFEEMEIMMRNTLSGIGAELQDKDGYCTISGLIDDGPAVKSKLLDVGDKIVGVGQETGEIVNVVGSKLRHTVSLIRGKPGTKVRLQIEAKGSGATKTITLTRDKVQLTTKLAKANIFEIVADDKTIPVGVIELLSFYGPEEGDSKGFSPTKDIEELLGKLKAQGVKGVILDMRKNGGGLLGEAVDLAGLFIRTGPILQVRNGNGRVEQLRDNDPKVVWDGPLILLVSKVSASATEIVAGALKNHERAIIIGDKTTYGKGTVQMIWKLSMIEKSQKGAAKVTIQKWYAPNGQSIQMKGVESDIVLPSILEYAEIGEDKKEHALAWDNIPSASIRAGYGYGEGEKGAELLAYLQEKSLERQKALPEFKFLSERVEWFKERQENKGYILNYPIRQKQLQDDEAFADKMKEAQKELAKSNFKSTEILLDGVIAKEAESKALREEKLQEEGAAKSEKIEELGTGQTDSAVPPQNTAEISPPTVSEKEENKKEKKSKKDDAPDFDIHLRESLRVMTDWILVKEKNNTAR